METDRDRETADAVTEPVGVARRIAVAADDAGGPQKRRGRDAVELCVAVGATITATGNARAGTADVGEQERQQNHEREPTHVHLNPSM